MSSTPLARGAARPGPGLDAPAPTDEYYGDERGGRLRADRRRTRPPVGPRGDRAAATRPRTSGSHDRRRLRRRGVRFVSVTRLRGVGGIGRFVHADARRPPLPPGRDALVMHRRRAALRGEPGDGVYRRPDAAVSSDRLLLRTARRRGALSYLALEIEETRRHTSARHSPRAYTSGRWSRSREA